MDRLCINAVLVQRVLMAHNALLQCNNIICITMYIFTLRKILYDAHKNLDKKHSTKKEILLPPPKKINYKT